MRTAFSKFYQRQGEFVVQYNIDLNALLQQGILEPVFYSDLVYKFNRTAGKHNFSDQFRNIISDNQTSQK